MIVYTPSYIVGEQLTLRRYESRQPRDYLPLYEHFARKVLDWRLPYELLIDTSGRGNPDFAPVTSQDVARTVLAKLFALAGTGCPGGTFLKRCGIRRWGDLAKPIRVQGRGCTARIDYDVRERRLVEPGPNEYHPGAVYAQGCWFQFGWDRKWRFVLRYGYSRDASAWDIEVRQGREALSTFINATVPSWLDDQLVPEEWSAQRTYRNRQHDRLSAAVDDVFAWDWCPGMLATDALALDLLDGRKPRLTKRRLGVLRRWMRADTRKEAKSDA